MARRNPDLGTILLVGASVGAAYYLFVRPRGLPVAPAPAPGRDRVSDALKVGLSLAERDRQKREQNARRTRYAEALTRQGRVFLDHVRGQGTYL